MVGLSAATLLKSLGMGAGHFSSFALVRRLMTDGPNPALLWSGVVGPLLGLSTLAMLSPPAERRLATWFWMPCALLVISVFDDPNAGGYVLPVSTILTVASAHTLATRPWSVWLLVPLLGVQVSMVHGISSGSVQHASADIRARRAAAAREALPDGGVLVCADFTQQTVAGLAPRVREINIWLAVISSVERVEPASAFAQRLADMLENEVGGGGIYAFDLSYAEVLVGHPEARERLDALVAEIRARHPGHVVDVNGVRMYRFGAG